MADFFGSSGEPPRLSAGGSGTDGPRGTIGPTSFWQLLAAFAVGVPGGFLLVTISQRASGTAPNVEWPTIGVLFTIAAVIAVLAYTTYRTVHRDRRPIQAHRAVNLLMLAKACAIVGAFLAGGYVGFGAHFVNDLNIALPRERAIRALVAAVVGVTIVISALLLERACRVPKDLDE